MEPVNFLDFLKFLSGLDANAVTNVNPTEPTPDPVQIDPFFDATGCEGCTGCDTDADQTEETTQVVDSFDLGGEMYREYIYPDGTVFTIDDPLELVINEHGNHVVAALDGNGYYVSPGWTAIHWQVAPGEDTISFV